jgi:hypothetical protein
MAQANYVPTVFCAAITGVNRNASTKPLESIGVRDLTGLVASSPRSNPPTRNIGPSRSGSCRDTARRGSS